MATTTTTTGSGKHMCDWPRPAVTVDALVVSPSPSPALLLIRRDRPPFAGCWALPGGFVDQGEGLDAAAARELEEETNLGAAVAGRLRQYGAYGDPGRDPRGWTVTIAYAALLERGSARPEAKAGDDAREARWWPLGDDEKTPPPPLAFDHARVVSDGLRVLAAEKEGEGGDGSLRALLLRAAEAYAHAPAAAPEEAASKGAS